MVCILRRTASYPGDACSSGWDSASFPFGKNGEKEKREKGGE
jgi:hypothetical protein